MAASPSARALEVAREVAGGHLVVDGDCWYSCPASGESCNDHADAGGRECDCGLEERVLRIARALDEFAATAQSPQSPMVAIYLSRLLADKLDEVLTGHQDEGPEGEGWASEELEQLRSIVIGALA